LSSVQRVVGLEQRTFRVLPGELRGSPAGVSSESLAKRRISSEPGNRFCECVDIAALDEQRRIARGATGFEQVVRDDWLSQRQVLGDLVIVERSLTSVAGAGSTQASASSSSSGTRPEGTQPVNVTRSATP